MIFCDIGLKCSDIFGFDEKGRVDENNTMNFVFPCAIY